MLHHIEMRMETLTQELEVLNQEKVELARVTCEIERRQREKEARMEKQRQMEAQRNKAALDRALAPPFRPIGRRPVFRFDRFFAYYFFFLHLYSTGLHLRGKKR